LRTTWIEGLQSTLAFWWLDIDSELLFVGDAGTTEASRPSRRYGVEWANYYSPSGWLTFDADFSYSHARFRGDARKVILFRDQSKPSSPRVLRFMTCMAAFSAGRACATLARVH